MEFTFPNYYKEFSCIAGSCPDTCCAGWQIVIDNKTLKKYQHFKGPFHNRLHNDIDWKEHVFRQYNRRCAFLNEENLCDIYTEAGPKMLCDTCRNYPRHIEEFEGLREISLSLSCPEAARILLSQKEKVHFVTIEKEAAEETYDDFDYFLFTALMDTRDLLIKIIQNRNVPIRKRLWKVLAITHDFKAPLGSIMGYTDLLARLTNDERQRFYLDNMKSSSQHLLKLVSDLLDFHRLDLNKAEVNRVTFNPSQLFEEIRTSFEPLTAAKGLVLEYKIESELDGRFISDPLRIRQIVNNLLSNAVKFTSKGGITLAVSYSSSRLRVAVTDTGKGMAAEDRERIFQEFTRLPGAQGEEGFGLGLSIVHKLVVLLEGTIDVQSTLGEGSTFTVILPLFPVGKAVGFDKDRKKNQSPSVTEADHIDREQMVNSPMNILLIDDDRIQLTLTAAMLEQQGIHATCCEQLDELTEHLRERRFDVLLTDVQMPAINGFDLLKLLRASNIPQAKTIPVIAVTARSDMDAAEFIEHGFSGCLHKPFTVAELLIQLKGESGKLKVSEELKTESGEPKVTMQEDCAANFQLSTFNFQLNLDFRALTAFSEDDPETARSILSSFVEETEKNIDQMEAGLKEEDTDRIAGMAHKLLPLLTMIKAMEILPLLSWLESRRNEKFSDEVKQKTKEVLPLLRQVVDEARKYFSTF